MLAMSWPNRQMGVGAYWEHVGPFPQTTIRHRLPYHMRSTAYWPCLLEQASFMVFNLRSLTIHMSVIDAEK